MDSKGWKASLLVFLAGAATFWYVSQTYHAARFELTHRCVREEPYVYTGWVGEDPVEREGTRCAWDVRKGNDPNAGTVAWRAFSGRLWKGFYVYDSRKSRESE